MASVLTNPLLVRGAKGYGSAKVELQRNPYRDPIELLEEYEREGAASVRVAELCMENVKKEYDSVPDARKPKLLEELQPGRRVFIWLLESGKYASADYADNVQFIELLVFFLVREGREDNIWHWLKLDVQAPDAPEGAPKTAQVSGYKTMLYKYRWRGRVLAALVCNQADVPWRPGTAERSHTLLAKNLHSAMSTFFTALALHISGVNGAKKPEQWHHLGWMPLGQSASFLVKLLTRRMRVHNPHGGDVELQKGDSIDPQLFDKLVESVPFAFEMGIRHTNLEEPRASYRMIDAAALHIVHPTKPSADPMLRILDVLFPENISDCPPKFYSSLQRHSDLRHSWRSRIIRSAVLLASQGRGEEAERAKTRIALYLPELAQYTEAHEREHSLRKADMSIAEDDDTDQSSRVPFPSFA